MGLYGARQSRKASQQSEANQDRITELNWEAAEQDILLTNFGARVERKNMITERALLSGQIEARSAASGVAAVGSVQAAMIENARQAARDDWLIEFERITEVERLTQQARIAEQTGEGYKSQARASGRRGVYEGTAMALGGVSSLIDSKKTT